MGVAAVSCRCILFKKMETDPNNKSSERAWYERLGHWWRTSVVVKLAFIGFAMLVLLIPQNMIEGLTRERQETRNGVIQEVSSKWGGAQSVTGLIVTLTYTVATDKGPVKKYFHLLPDKLDISGKLEPQVRRRSLYEVLLYNAQLDVRGELTLPALAPYGIADKDVAWDQASLSIGIADLRGVKDSIVLHCNGARLETAPGLPTPGLLPQDNGVSALARLHSGQKISFSYHLNLNGSGRLFLSPVGKITNVQLSAPWSTPSFGGEFLPETRAVTPQGFTAHWQVLHLNRNIPQAFHTAGGGNDRNQYAAYEDAGLQRADFGVDLLIAIDGYQTTARSTKYGSMIILLTFLTFFLVEVTSGRQFHPVQYLMIGSALVLFYLLLLSLCEYIAFGWAYLVGCTVIVGLVTYYARFVFDSVGLTLRLGGILAAAYGFFYILLELADYALITGTLGLLLVLATVMYLTRKFDWYNLRQQ